MILRYLLYSSLSSCSEGAGWCGDSAAGESKRGSRLHCGGRKRLHPWRQTHSHQEDPHRSLQLPHWNKYNIFNLNFRCWAFTQFFCLPVLQVGQSLAVTHPVKFKFITLFNPATCLFAYIALVAKFVFTHENRWLMFSVCVCAKAEQPNRWGCNKGTSCCRSRESVCRIRLASRPGTSSRCSLTEPWSFSSGGCGSSSRGRSTMLLLLLQRMHLKLEVTENKGISNNNLTDVL